MSEKLSVKVKTKELLEAIKIVENFISREKMGKESLKGICIEANKKELLDYYADNPDYAAALLRAGKSKNIAQSFSDIHKYEMLTAQHGADLAQFHIKWFKELQKKINAGLF